MLEEVCSSPQDVGIPFSVDEDRPEDENLDTIDPGEILAFENDYEPEHDDDNDHNEEDAVDVDPWFGNEEEEDEQNPYFELLQAISQKWLLVELSHTVSKAATNAFWEIAVNLLPSLYKKKERHGISRKIPQFVHIRRKLQKDLLPPIHRTTAYQDAETNDIIEVSDPKFRPNDVQKKIYETTSVKVSLSAKKKHADLLAIRRLRVLCSNKKINWILYAL